MSVARHGPFVINCSSAVTLVFLNRRLLASCAFRYVGLLAALHMGVTALIALVQAPLSAQKTALQPQEVLFFMCFTVVSMVSMNLSLMLNHVGVYQISKIAMIPTCCALEYVLMGKLLTRARAAAVVVVCAGVFIACVALRLLLHVCAALTRAHGQHGVRRVVVVGWLHRGACGCPILLQPQRAVQQPDQEVRHLGRHAGPRHRAHAGAGAAAGRSFRGQAAGAHFSLGVAAGAGRHHGAVLQLHPAHLRPRRGCEHQPGVLHQDVFRDGCARAVCIRSRECSCSSAAGIDAGSQVLGHAKTVLILVICWLEHESNPNIVLWRQYVGAAVAMTGLLAYNWASAPAQGAVAAAKPAAVTSAPPAAEEEVAAQVLDGGDTELCEVHSRGKSAHAGNET